MTDQTKGLLITVIAVLLIVPDSLFIRLNHSSDAVILFWRSLLTGIVITVWLLLTQARSTIDAWVDIRMPQLIFTVGLIGSATLFVLSIQHTSVANTVFILASMPVFSALFSWIFIGERISPRIFWTIILVTLGIGAIAFGSINETKGSLLGDFFALSTAACFAASTTAARKARQTSMVPMIPIAFFAITIGTLFFANPTEINGTSIWLIGIHGGIFIPISMALFTIGPRYITAPEISLLILGESIFAPILVWFVLGEFPGNWALIGGAIVIGVLAVSNVIAFKKLHT